MEEDLTSDLTQYRLPIDIDVPITHEVPKTTLDSLFQLKKEFEIKINDAIEKNDNRKKGRYQRTLKQFESAIKATKTGKDYNYDELQTLVPPGFAKIPLQDGRPVIKSTSSRLVSAVETQERISLQPKKREKSNDPEEASDDLLKMLENELDIKDVDDDDDGCIDPEEEKFNKQIKAAQKLIPNLPVPKDEVFDEKIIPIKKNSEPIQENDQVSEINQIPKIVKVSKKQQSSKKSNQNSKTVQKHDKELAIVLERQRLFKEAALKAKQDGNTSVALAYLRHSKGFDSMIAAAENGLPLDMSNLPMPPQLQSVAKKTNVSLTTSEFNQSLNSKLADDLDIPISGDRNTIYKTLLDKLRQQIEISSDNFKHFTKMGDINNASKFKKIAQESIQDLEALKNADRLNEPVPLYHYEKRFYETIECNSDLTDNDLEVIIVRAVNLSLPKDYKVDHMNTFVKFEFPFPPEDFQSDKTKVQHASCNPEYNQSFRLQIQRKQTKFMRLMNRKDLKLEIYIKGGFLRSDKLLANCAIKLQPLENSTTLHNAYELLEGRRQTGGKLEVIIRIREPLLHKGVKTMEHKWLIIDKFKLTYKNE